MSLSPNLPEFREQRAEFRSTTRIKKQQKRSLSQQHKEQERQRQHLHVSSASIASTALNPEKKLSIVRNRDRQHLQTDEDDDMEEQVQESEEDKERDGENGHDEQQQHVDVKHEEWKEPEQETKTHVPPSPASSSSITALPKHSFTPYDDPLPAESATLPWSLPSDSSSLTADQLLDWTKHHLYSMNEPQLRKMAEWMQKQQRDLLPNADIDDQEDDDDELHRGNESNPFANNSITRKHRQRGGKKRQALQQQQMDSLARSNEHITLAQQPSPLPVPTPEAMPNASLNGCISHRDWNAEFQRLMTAVADDETILDAQSAFEALSELAADFTFTARTIGRIIIQEKYLPIQEKTIKPVKIGGVAGGEKYVVHNIVFKFQVDNLHYYGNDEYAGKAGNHELLGLSHCYRAIMSLKGIDLHVPLACLITHRGFRLWAVSRLPITNESLVWGSQDSGKNIVNTAPRSVIERMGRLAVMLNLKQHYVSDKEGKQTLLFGPFDMEVHKGTDQLFYALDFHRVFCPEPPRVSAALNLKNPHLYRMLRPELIRGNDKPLSSDSFVAHDSTTSEQQKRCMEEVHEAYQNLRHTIIPRFAAQLDEIGTITQIEQLRLIQQRTMESLIMKKAKRSVDIRTMQQHQQQQQKNNNNSNNNNTTQHEQDILTAPESPLHKEPPSPLYSFASLASASTSSCPPSPSASSTVIGSSTPSVPTAPSTNDPVSYCSRLIAYLHQSGINVRLLGVVRSFVTSKPMRDMILVEMIARVLKNDLRARWRAKMASVKYISEGIFRRCSIEFINLVFLHHSSSTQYWQQTIKMELAQRFESQQAIQTFTPLRYPQTDALSAEEMAPLFDLKAALLPSGSAAPSVTQHHRQSSNQSSHESSGTSSPLPASPPFPALLPSSTFPSLPSSGSPSYALSAAHERRLSQLLQIDTAAITSTNTATPTEAITHTSSADANAAITYLPLAASNSSTSARSSTASTSPVVSEDLLRLVFVRFIQLTGLILEESILPPNLHSQQNVNTFTPQQQPPLLVSTSMQKPSGRGSHPLNMQQQPSVSYASRRPSGTWEQAQPLQSMLMTSLTPAHATATPLHPTAMLHRSASSSGLLPSHQHTRSFTFTQRQISSSSSNSQPAAQAKGSSSFPADSAATPFLFFSRPMEDLHLLAMEEQVKTLNIVSYAEGTALLCKCVSKSKREHGHTTDDPTLTHYLADLAAAKFIQSLCRDVDDCLALCNYSMLRSLVFKDPEQAKQLLLSALYANPNHHRSYYYLAQLYAHALKQPHVSAFLFTTALRLNNQHVNTHKDFANLLYYQYHDAIRAEKHYRLAVEIQPAHIKAQLALGLCLARRAKDWLDFNRVMECYRTAAKSNYGDEYTRNSAQQQYMQLICVKAELHWERGEQVQATQCIEEALAYRPPPLLPHQYHHTHDSTTSLYHSTHYPPVFALVICAQLYARQRKHRDAKEMFLKAIETQRSSYRETQKDQQQTQQTAPGTATTLQPHRASVNTAANERDERTEGIEHNTQPDATIVKDKHPPRAMKITPSTSALTAQIQENTKPVPRIATPPQRAQPQPPRPSSTETQKQTQQQKIPTMTGTQSSRGITIPSPSAAVPIPIPGSSPASLTSPPAPNSSLSPNSSWSLALSSSPPTAPLNMWTVKKQWLPDDQQPQKTKQAPITTAMRPHPPLLATERFIASKPTALVPAAIPTVLTAIVASEAADVQRHPDAANHAFSPTTTSTPSANESLSDSSFPVSVPDLALNSSSVSSVASSSSSSSSCSSSSASDCDSESLFDLNAESVALDTTVIRLCADYLCGLGAAHWDEAERWYRYAIDVCPFGRSGSLNFSAYARFLGRTRHLQFEAERFYQRAVAAINPAAPAMYDYADYIRDVVQQDMHRIARLREEAGKIKHSPHTCMQTRSGWYCDGQCGFYCMKFLIKAAINQRDKQQRNNNSTNSSSSYNNNSINNRGNNSYKEFQRRQGNNKQQRKQGNKTFNTTQQQNYNQQKQQQQQQQQPRAQSGSPVPTVPPPSQPPSSVVASPASPVRTSWSDIIAKAVSANKQQKPQQALSSSSNNNSNTPLQGTGVLQGRGSSFHATATVNQPTTTTATTTVTSPVTQQLLPLNPVQFPKHNHGAPSTSRFTQLPTFTKKDDNLQDQNKPVNTHPSTHTTAAAPVSLPLPLPLPLASPLPSTTSFNTAAKARR